jgi:hypothetical protein
MNQVLQNKCEYICPNITIEIISVMNKGNKNIYYVYNYKGISFRLFTSKTDLENFFNNLPLEYLHFETEEQLDLYLSKVSLS